MAVFPGDTRKPGVRWWAAIRYLVQTLALMAVVCATSIDAAAGVALVQATSAQATGVPSIAKAFPNSNTAGNLIIVFVRASTTSQTVTVNDSAGNTYAEAVGQVQTADGHQIHIHYAKNIASGPNTVTATFSGTNNHPWLAIYEYSGLSTSSPLDRTARAQGSGAAPNSGPTPATSAPVELVFAAVGLPASSAAQITAGNGYTILQQDTGLSGTSPGGNEAQTVAATGAYSGTFALSASANWSAVAATFVAAGQAPALVVSTASLPSGTVSAGYSATLAAAGGTPPYTWSIVSGNRPAGLSLTASTGMIAGTPSAAGTSNFTVQVKDANLQTASTALSIAIGSTSRASIALVQSQAVQGSGVTSVWQQFANSNTAGNLIIAFVRMSTTSQTVTVTDTAGNTYLQATSQAQSSDGHQLHLFYAANIKGGANTVTAAFSATNNHPWLAIYEYSGLSTASTLDQTAQAQGSSDAANCPAAAATSSSNELLFAGLGVPSSSPVAVTAGAGYALELQDGIQYGSRAASEDSITAVSGTYSGGFALSAATNWSCVLATFKAAAPAAALVSIAVTPANPSIPQGATQQFAAIGTMSDGTRQDLTATAAWSSSQTAVATIDSAGLATAAATGTTSIRAASGTVSASTTLSVAINITTQHYEYVFPDGAMYVYDIDNNFALVKQVSIPQAQAIRGVVASIPTHTLYISYGGDGDGNGNGSMLAYDLLADKELWPVNYSTGVDSMAIGPDGKTIYMPTGELNSGTAWDVLDASNGSIIGTIGAAAGPHNTVVSLDGTRVYMAGAHWNYLVVASTATNTVIRGIGPLTDAVRPFTINGKQTLAFTTATAFLGFQVSDINTGQVLYSVPIAGFTVPPGFASGTPSHGISLSPLDEKEIWVMDSANSYVHVFDVSGLPGSPPVQVADLPLSRPMTGYENPCVYDCHRSGWVRHTRDGRYVVVGDSGDIIDAATRKLVINLDPLYNTRKHLEIDWQNGLPVFTTSRYGLGYVTQ